MKHKLFFVCLLLAVMGKAQSNFPFMTYGTASLFPREIFFGDTGQIYITGQCNIRGTINNEISWNGYCYTILNIFGGCSPSLANTFVVGEEGLIRKNEACEIFGSWIDQVSNTTDSLFSVKFLNNNLGVVVGEGGTILRTTNNGSNWQAIASPISTSLYNLTVKPNASMVACGASGAVIASVDSGQTWQPLNTGIFTSLYDINFPCPDTGYAVGAAGVLLRTIDGGISWQPLNSGVLTKISAVDFINKDVGMIVGDDGLLKRTIDAGITWNTIPFSSFYDLIDIQFKDQQNGYFITTQETYRTSDGGLTWRNMAADLQAVQYLNDSILVAVGEGIVRKSVDNGYTWNVTQPINGVRWYDLDFINPDTGFICGYSGQIMKTVDGGANYVSQISNPVNTHYYFNIHFFNKDTGIAVGAPYLFSTTTNGGATWNTTSSPNPNIYGYYDIFFINRQVGWICGSQGAVRKSVNGGQSFFPQSTGTTNYLNAIYFLDSLKGFACGGSGTLIRTLDGGNTWTNISTPTSSDYYCIAFVDSLLGYVTTGNGGLLTTINGGNTWTFSFVDFNITDIALYNPYKGFAVGYGDARLNYDPIRNFNSYQPLCRVSSSFCRPVLAPNVSIGQGNIFIFELDTTGNDFNDPVILGAVPSDTSRPYLYFSIADDFPAGNYSSRVRTTFTHPVNTSMKTQSVLYEIPRGTIWYSNDTIFATYNEAYNYTWRRNFVTYPSKANYLVPDSSGTYTVTIKYGCCNDLILSITLGNCNNEFIVAPTIDQNIVGVCDSSIATFSVTGSGTIVWYDSDTAMAPIATGHSFQTPPITMQQYFYVASQLGVCESPRIRLTAYVATPSANPGMIGDTVCSGQPAFLFSNNGIKVKWYSTAFDSLALSESNFFYIPSATTSDTFYTANYYDQCVNDRTPVVLTVLESPTLNTIMGDTVVIPGDTVYYAYPIIAGENLNWTVSGGIITYMGDSLGVYWPQNAQGVVTLVATNANGCSTDTIRLHVSVNILNGLSNGISASLTVYPNPAVTEIHIRTDGQSTGNTIYIHDHTGRVVSEYQVLSGGMVGTIPVGHFAAGTYYISTRINNGVVPISIIR